MNGFPRIELEGLGNNKALCQQVICSAAGMQRELEKLFHRSSFPGDAGGNVVDKKRKKKDWKGNQNSDSDTAGKGLHCFYGFLFFFVGDGGFTHSSDDQKLFQLIKACTLSAIG